LLFLIHCTDRPDGAPIRDAARAAHVAFIRAQEAVIVAAGPTVLDDDDQRPTGSVYIVDCADRAAAETFLAGDPFTAAGLFGQVSIQRWRRGPWGRAGRD